MLTANEDFFAELPVNLTLNSGSRQASVFIFIIDDQLLEEQEFTTLVLTTMTADVKLADPSSFLIDIVDNDC